MVLSFQHVAAELRLICGEHSLKALTRELAREGCNRAVIVCGRSVNESAPMEMMRKILGPALVGECVTARQNSPLQSVMETAQLLGDLKADNVIAVGGGSAAVTARAATILLAERAPAQTLSTRRLPDGSFESPRLNAPKLPQFVVPTTPSTAFVKAGSAVLDVETGHRLALFDPKTRAKALFVHPDFLRTAPAMLVQNSCLNTFSTAVEALISPKCDPIAEAMLLHSLRLIARHLDSSTLDDTAARNSFVLAAILCGRGTEQAGGGLGSVLAHAIGSHSSVANGIVNAIVLPHVLRFNLSETATRLDMVRDVLYRGFERNSKAPAPTGVVVVESLLRQLAVPHRLRDIGIALNDLPGIANNATSDWFITRNNPRASSYESVLTILEACW